MIFAMLPLGLDLRGALDDARPARPALGRGQFPREIQKDRAVDQPIPWTGLHCVVM